MTQVQLRIAILLILVALGGICLIVGMTGVPHWNRALTAAAVVYLFAYIYAQLTKPRTF